MSEAAKTKKPLILVALCGGGWYRETYRILDRFPRGEFRFAYAYGHQGGVHGAARLPMPHEGPCFPIHYLGPTRKSFGRWIKNPVRFVASLFEALTIVARVRPSVVFVLGAATAIPLFLAAKCFGGKCVFIESLTRVERLSLTGRIIHRFGLADRLYVQWERLHRELAGTEFAGAVL